MPYYKHLINNGAKSQLKKKPPTKNQENSYMYI